MLIKQAFHRLRATPWIILLTACALASPVNAASPVGSTNVTSADPTVPRPPGKPCVVQLLPDTTFTDFDPRTFSYTPPAGCKGSWSKVVLEADFSVTAGIQFDRTANLWLRGVNLYFGTTSEPSPTVSPSWHVERDLTDYSALLRNAGNGQAVIGNIVNDQYTGVIHGSARLLFYPASILALPPRVPDAVYPLGSDPVGSTVTLNTAADSMSKAFTLPRNVERAYLDVFVQSQNADEFWYTCVPDQYAAEVEECGGGNFREGEVSIDGQPAGVVPVYPWIYTGGIDTGLWRPTPGVQTLNFMPYRVDLTPFAGVLSNGATHTVAVNVAGANTYFSATASLLVYLDAHAKQINGAVTKNTLATQPPTPIIGDTLVTDSNGNVTGNINTNLSRHFVIEGYADTSHGRVTSSVEQTVGFADTQGFTINDSTYRQVSDQLTTANSVSRSRLGLLLTGEYDQNVSYPFHLDYNQQVQSDGSATVATTVHQGYQQNQKRKLLGITLYSADVNNTMDTADTENFNAAGAFTGRTNWHSAQTFTFKDSLGSCYRGDVTAMNAAVSSYSTGQGCPNQANRLQWFSHPDGSPDNGNTILGW